MLTITFLILLRHYLKHGHVSFKYKNKKYAIRKLSGIYFSFAIEELEVVPAEIENMGLTGIDRKDNQLVSMPSY